MQFVETIQWREENYLLEKLKELNKKSPLELEAWEIDALMQTALEQAVKIESLEKISSINVYDNGVAEIVYEDSQIMLIDDVTYCDAVLTGWDEEDIRIKR
nr:MAG TPA: hypothetical protein [Caudoviricetes sp.]